MAKKFTPLDSSAIAAVYVDVDGFALTSDEQGVPISKVEVTLEVDRPGSFVIECTDLDDDEIEWIDDGSVAEGKPVTISMGTIDGLIEVMVGEVTGIEIDASSEDETKVTIRGYDRLHRLTRGRRTRAFTGQKDSAIAETIARENGLTASAEATAEAHEYVLQSEESDLAFLSARARAIGYTIFVEDTILYFGPRPLTDGADYVLDETGYFARLSIRTSVLGLAGGVAVRGWNPKDQVALVANAAASSAAMMGGSTSGGTLADDRFGAAVAQVAGFPVTTQGQADALAAAEVQESALKYVTCEVEVVGEPGLLVGTIVTITRLSKRLSGDYYVDRVHHVFADGAYNTTFEGKRTAT
jgi:uncharacterized protein